MWRCDKEEVWLPILISNFLKNEEELTPELLLKKLGAHPEVQGSCIEDDVDPYENIEDENTALHWGLCPFENNTSKVKAFFDKYKQGKLISFTCAEEKLNPNPCFVVTKISKNVIGGLMTAL